MAKQRRRRISQYLFLFLLIALISYPFASWQLNESRQVSLQIVDKSVPNTKYREHEGLTWTLNHLKFLSPTQSDWQAKSDYIGYYPDPDDLKKDRHEPLKTSHLKGKNVLFLADTYGVYKNDLTARQTNAQESAEAQDYSPLIYGGVLPEEMQVIQKFADSGGHVIGEFNTFASPTKKDVRSQMENLFGVKWTGWAARFFDNLNEKTEVPHWAYKKWKAQYHTDWPFEGPGWIFVHDDGTLFVLKEGEDIAIKGLKIHVKQTQDPYMKDCYSEVPFYFWFDILEAKDDKTVLAEYKITLTEKGKAQFRRFSLPEHFPAVVRKQSNPLRLYMAGDFSDTGFSKGFYKMSGRVPLESFWRFKEKMPTQQAFFWEFYVPLIQNVFNDLAPEAKS